MEKKRFYVLVKINKVNSVYNEMSCFDYSFLVLLL